MRYNLAPLKKATESLDASLAMGPSVGDTVSRPLEMLAAGLLNDPDDDVYFTQLIGPSLSVVPLQSDFCGVLVEALADDQFWMSNLDQHGTERFLQLLENVSVSDSSIRLALALLDQRPILSEYNELGDDIIIAALSHLHRARPQFTPEHIVGLLAVACDYGFELRPAGSYEKRFEIDFNFEGDESTSFDLGGAGAVLLLKEVDSEDLKAALELSEINLSLAAVEFSRRYPSSPNLLIDLMQVRGCEQDLELLHDYQRDRMSNSEFLELMTYSIKRGIKETLSSVSLIMIILKSQFGVRAGPLETLGAVLMPGVVMGLLHGFKEFYKVLRERKLSPLHKDHLNEVLASKKAAGV